MYVYDDPTLERRKEIWETAKRRNDLGKDRARICRGVEQFCYEGCNVI